MMTIPMGLTHMKSLFLTILLAFLSTVCNAQSVYESNGSIFLKDQKGSEIRLTYSGRDSEPSLSPDGAMVAFVRDTPQKRIWTGIGEAPATELWIVDVSSKKAERVLRAKNSDKMEERLSGFHALQFSQDSDSIYFLSEAWATSGAVHRLNLTTKKERFIVPGLGFEVIREGEYSGYLKVRIRKYYEEFGRGAYDCDYVLTPEGKEIKVIEDTCEE